MRLIIDVFADVARMIIRVTGQGLRIRLWLEFVM